MPFTPFHMGPGLAIKAVLQGAFSLLVFGWTQILMDIQPLLVLISGAGHLHGFSHTYLGASLIALAATLTGKPLAQFTLWWLQPGAGVQIRIPWSVACLSAFIGSFSHVVLDSIMHTDVEPFYPFSAVNPLLGYLSVTNLHRLCILLMIMGAILYGLIRALHLYRVRDKDRKIKEAP